MSKLYIVPTPIGNLKDITIRALDVLREADAIACEDTRVTSKLLSKYEIRKPLINYREHTENVSGNYILDRVRAGETIALVTDAGMPGISDPGEVVIRAAIEEGIEFEVLPGASALLTSLVGSGINTGTFTFIGFLGKAKKVKRDTLKRYAERKETLILYEAPHRLKDTLTAIIEVLGNRRITVSREITKLYEEHLRGTAEEIRAVFEEKEPRGEFVIIIAGKSEAEISLERTQKYEDLSIRDHLVSLIEQGIDKKTAIKMVSELRDIPKKEVYKESLDV